jgi:hypothetical protein
MRETGNAYSLFVGNTVLRFMKGHGAGSHRPPTTEARVSTRGFSGGQSGSGTRFSQRFSVVPCQYHSTMAVHTHILLGENNRPVGGRVLEKLSHPIGMNNIKTINGKRAPKRTRCR